MDNLLILYSDGSVKSKDYRKISMNDIMKASYFMISTEISDNPEYRNYVIIPPNECLLFDKCIIDYQLGIMYNTPDDMPEYYPIDPIHMVTDNISDVFGILNCADKINIVNNVSRDCWDESNTDICVLYLGIQLFRKGNCIYNHYYEKKENSSSLNYISYKVTNKFKKIYNAAIAREFMEQDMNIYLFYNEKKKLKWECASDRNDYEMMGVPLVQSNTFTFLSKDEYDILMKYQSIEALFFIYYEKSKYIEKINTFIEDEENYDRALEIIDDCPDVYISTKSGECYYRGDRYGLYRYIDILSHQTFIFQCVNLFYSEMYPYQEPFEGPKYGFEEDDRYIFYSTFYIKFIDSLKNKSKNTRFIFTEHRTKSIGEIFLQL